MGCDCSALMVLPGVVRPGRGIPSVGQHDGLLRDGGERAWPSRRGGATSRAATVGATLMVRQGAADSAGLSSDELRGHLDARRSCLAFARGHLNHQRARP